MLGQPTASLIPDTWTLFRFCGLGRFLRLRRRIGGLRLYDEGHDAAEDDDDVCSTLPFAVLSLPDANGSFRK